MIQCDQWAKEGRSIQDEITKLSRDTQDIHRVRQLIEKRIEESRNGLFEMKKEIEVGAGKR